MAVWEGEAGHRERGDVRRFGLADALGLTVTAVALVYFQGMADPASYPKLLVLVVGASAAAPWVAHRWFTRPWPPIAALVPAGAVVALALWAVVCTLASDAPWPVRLFGWWLRADGVLGLLAASILLLGAMTFTRAEVTRALSWLIGGAAVVALVGVPQVLGTHVLGTSDREVLGTLGQSNFAAGYLAVMTPLALSRVFEPRATWQRWSFGVLALLLAAMAVLTTALQGPMALGGGLLAFGITGAVLVYGPHRRRALIAAAVAGGLAFVIAVMVVVGLGPLAFVRAEGNTIWRYHMWIAALDTMRGLPVFGTGPGSTARRISEFRPLSTVQVTGGDMRPSAVHSIPLQFGVSYGEIGLILWLVLVISILVLVVRRIRRGPVRSIPLWAAVSGAFAAYVTQALVSIDTPSIMGVGWIVMGLVIAVAREPERDVPEVPADEARRRGARRRPSTRWLLAGASLVLAAVAGGAVGEQIAVAQGARGALSTDDVAAMVADPWLPCPLRVDLTNAVLQQLPLDVAVPIVRTALLTDERCPPMINVASSAAMQSRDVEWADAATARGVELDPFLPAAWRLRAQYFTLAGNPAAAEQANAEADRLEGTSN